MAYASRCELDRRMPQINGTRRFRTLASRLSCPHVDPRFLVKRPEWDSRGPTGSPSSVARYSPKVLQRSADAGPGRACTWGDPPTLDAAAYTR